MSLAVIKFSSEECGICHKMSFYDQKVTEELGMEFVSVKMQDTATYRKYRKILLSQYPDKADMGWPTYLVCESPEADFKILGEVKGGHPKGEFRSRLQEVLDQCATAELAEVPRDVGEGDAVSRQAHGESSVAGDGKSNTTANTTGC